MDRIELGDRPRAQDALKQAIENHALDYPDPDGEPQNPTVLRYGDDENDYIDVQFVHGEVVVRDGNDPTGEAHKYTEDEWRSFTGQPSREEAAAALKKDQAAKGIGLEGLKTGEVEDRQPADR